MSTHEDPSHENASDAVRPDLPAEALFGDVRRAVLDTLFVQTDEPLHVREIIRRSGVGQGSVQRELRHLHAAGLLERRERDGRVYYRADEHSPAFEQLRALLAGSPVAPRELEVVARATVERYDMLPQGAPLLVLVSGGADSTALLRLLAAGALGDRHLRVLHVDHALRDESPDDAAWVAALCRDLGVECRVVREDVAALADAEDLNLEDAGRRVRYRLAEEYADELARGLGVPAAAVRIATAHTRDDQVETFLMRIATGAGMRGLSGIAPVRGRVARPLLDAERTDILAYLRGLGQGWREDATNADVSRLRARVRHEIVPLFRAINPSFGAAVARTAAHVAQDDEVLQELADAFARDFDVSSGRELGDDLELDLALMRTLSRPIARRVLGTCITGRFPEASRIESEHLDALARGLSRDAFARDITGGLRVRCEYGRIVVSRGEGLKVSLERAVLEVPGTTDLGRVGRIEGEMIGPGEPATDPFEAWLDADSVEGSIEVGPPHTGERMRPLGMTGHKLLSDILTDAKVPAGQRSATPVVRAGGRVVWVAGVRISDDHKVTPATERVLRLVWHRPDE